MQHHVNIFSHSGWIMTCRLTQGEDDEATRDSDIICLGLG